MQKLYDIIESISLSVLIITVTILFCFRIVVVEGDSMMNTLHNQERIITSNFLYTPEKGDIVVTDSNNGYGHPIIKRVIATGGDIIRIDYETGDVYVNDELLQEDYIFEKINPEPRDNIETTIPEGYLFVMGDNRNRSADSRSDDIGLINENNLLGRAVFRISPLSKIGKLK